MALPEPAFRLCVALCLLTGLLCLSPPPAGAGERADALRFEAREIVEAPRHGPDRRFLDAALQRAHRHRLREGKSAPQRPKVSDHTVELVWPVREAVGVTDNTVQAISNFLDQDPIDIGLEDWNCGGSAARTYDGHNGLDIYLAPFSWWQMEQDSGIVVAAAPGVIRDKVNDQPERSCTIDNNGGDNNLVVIEHEDGSLGIYAHMRTGSLTAKPLGATVEVGEYLGVIGSSGYSTGPHLHFEVGFWENGGWTPQDPYQGQCNDINDTSWWKAQPAYYEPAIMSVASHSGPPSQPPCPQTEDPKYADAFNGGDTVYFSFTLRDLRQGDRADIELRQPDGSRYTGTSYTEQNAHIASGFITFSLSLPPAPMAGDWTFQVAYAGEQASHSFRVDSPAPDPVVLGSGNNAWNGLWYDPALNGEGYNIVTSSAGTVIFFYGSDVNGQRLWLVSEVYQKPFDNGQPHRIVMYESTGGVFAQPISSSRGLSPWGELVLTFGDCTAGSARLVGVDGNKTASIVKLTGVPGSNCVDGVPGVAEPHSGLWYDPALDGEGFNFVVTPFGTVLFYYGFDAQGNRLWLISDTFDFSYAGGTEITVALYKATAGDFADPVPVSVDETGRWGTITIEGISCSRMDYRLDTKEGDKVMAGQRLVSVVGLDC